MRMSTRGRYGLRFIVALAENTDKGPMPLKEIALEQGISEKYLEQIVNQLTKAGYVKSYRGSQGGYVFAKDPKEVSVEEVLRTLEGSLSPVACACPNSSSTCPKSQSCKTQKFWQKMSQAIYDVANSVKITDLMETYEK